MRTAGALFALLSLSALPALANEDAAPRSIPGWNEYVDSLRDLPQRMLAKLPESMRRDPQIQQEVGRLALEAAASSALEALGGNGNYPVFLPTIGQVLNVGQPNADTVYRAATITPGGSYRLRGTRGSLRMLNIGQGGASPDATREYLDLNALRIDAQGRFDVLLSPTRPAGHTGEWWPLQPNTSRLLLRMVSSDWSRERDPTLSIERVDKPMAHTRASAAELEQRLRRLPAAMNFIGLLFVDHVAQLRAQGFVNKLKVLDVSQMGGLTGQFYYEGAYELREDEALIVTATVPKQCVYRSMILTNDLYETTDWTNNHSSLNDSQAAPDADGVLRIVVSAQDPGVSNWLDTAGYATGLMQGRWYECDTQPIPSVTKVAFADVRKALPRQTKTITQEERDRMLRERRAAYQQRPLW